jgi:hypothetical protein
LAAFTINIAESNFRRTQVEHLSAKPRSGFVVPTIDFKLPYGFVIVRIDRRGLVLINVTTNCDGGVDRTPDHGGLPPWRVQVHRGLPAIRETVQTERGAEAAPQ